MVAVDRRQRDTARDIRVRMAPFGYLLAVLLTAALVVWLAPAERTMGGGIKAVYVHVSLTLSGMFGFVLAGLLGVAVLITGSFTARRWMLSTGRAGLALYAGGVLTSVVAAWINWGAVFLAEPLLRNSLALLAVTVIAFALTSFTERPRLQGLLCLLPALGLGWLLAASSLLLHPGGGVLAKSAPGIRWTFAMLTALWVVGAAGLVWHFSRRRPLRRR